LLSIPSKTLSVAAYAVVVNNNIAKVNINNLRIYTPFPDFTN